MGKAVAHAVGERQRVAVLKAQPRAVYVVRDLVQQLQHVPGM